MPLQQFIPSAESEALLQRKKGLPVPLCPDLRMGLVTESCTLVCLALHPVKLHKCWPLWVEGGMHRDVSFLQDLP